MCRPPASALGFLINCRAAVALVTGTTIDSNLGCLVFSASTAMLQLALAVSTLTPPCGGGFEVSCPTFFVTVPRRQVIIFFAGPARALAWRVGPSLAASHLCLSRIHPGDLSPLGGLLVPCLPHLRARFGKDQCSRIDSTSCHAGGVLGDR